MAQATGTHVPVWPVDATTAPKPAIAAGVRPMKLAEVQAEADKDLSVKPTAALVFKWDKHAGWAAGVAAEAKAKYEFALRTWEYRKWGVEHFPEQFTPDLSKTLEVVLAHTADVTTAIEAMRDAVQIHEVASRMASLVRLRYEGTIDRWIHRPPQPVKSQQNRRK